MIEVLKQALEALKDVGVLTDREWQAVHKNKANELRQAIAELESQKPDVVRLSNGTFDVIGSKIVPLGALLYLHPPQRTWVGLTDDEIEQLELTSATSTDIREIQAKLKEKNHGNW
jgi:transcription initiation factor IIE alpha subunit